MSPRTEQCSLRFSLDLLSSLVYLYVMTRGIERISEEFDVVAAASLSAVHRVVLVRCRVPYSILCRRGICVQSYMRLAPESLYIAPLVLFVVLWPYMLGKD